MAKKLWELSPLEKEQTNLSALITWLFQHKNLHFENYTALWEWSIHDAPTFWAFMVEYFDIHFHTPANKILSEDKMPFTKWFQGATLNYAESVFQAKNNRPALKFYAENQTSITAYSWDDLEKQVASVTHFLKSQGVEQGDRVVGYLPNRPEAIIAFLAAASLGAIWSSCSPDFGTQSVVERFQQIEPKILFTVDGYFYNGKFFDRQTTSCEIAAALPTLKAIVNINLIAENELFTNIEKSFSWKKIIATEGGKLLFKAVNFDHPLYILYSSGTTGIPKAIVHGHGGITLEHCKYLSFHNDLKAGETFFWFTTTGWMMWNFSVSTLMLGATLFLYDGSPTYPDVQILWQLAQQLPIHHFGTSAPYIGLCAKKGLHFGADDLANLRSISSTGSPLPPESYDFIYKHIKSSIWLISMSGGTDVCTAWVGGNPLMPVFEGEIQSRCLGCAMESWDELGKSVLNEVGEMVVTQALPSMPVKFWNDPNFEKYMASYFEMYPSVWRHGDWLKITEHGSLEILGRSDATLNRQGVRIGTAEIYRVLEGIEAVKDSLILNIELTGGQHFMPLFVVLQAGESLTDELKNNINQSLKTVYSPRHVPDAILEVSDIPYTISGKKLEAPIKKILMGIPLSKAANVGSMRNPESLNFFITYAKNFEEQRILA
jgi:acetoacetyl-CoA synthetase